MLPRSSANARSGCTAASWARRRTDPVRDARARAEAPARVLPTSASRGSARSGNAASTMPSGGGLDGQVLGRVHRDVGPAVEHGLLHLLHEHAGAAHGRGSACPVRASPVVVTITSSTSSPSSDATRSACQRASAVPRVADAARVIPRGSDVGLRKAEQLDERVGVELAARGAGGILQADGGLVQQLVDECLRESPRPRRAAAGSSASSLARVTFELADAERRRRGRAAR